MQALVGQSADAARSVREAAEAKLSRELDAAEVRHAASQKKAVSAAVTEALAQRKAAEERAVQRAVSSAVGDAERAAQVAVLCCLNWRIGSSAHLGSFPTEVTRAREVASAEARGRAEEAKRTAAAVRVAVEEAVVHTMARIKPALQKQEEVEAAIRRAEERAREMERMQASQVENRIKELAQDVASQPAAVQKQIRAAVTAVEDRNARQLAQVHQTYKEAADEQQLQIKELLQQAVRGGGARGRERTRELRERCAPNPLPRPLSETPPPPPPDRRTSTGGTSRRRP